MHRCPSNWAQALYDPPTDGSAQLLYVSGEDAKVLLQARKEIGEEALIDTMRQRFGLTG